MVSALRFAGIQGWLKARKWLSWSQEFGVFVEFFLIRWI